MRQYPNFLNRIFIGLGFLSVAVFVLVGGTSAHDQEGQKAIGNSAGAGIGGDGPWECNKIELLGRMALSEIGGGPSNVLGNDCWGWTDPATGKEYAIFGLTNGTSFIDISDPTDPKYLGKLNTQTNNRTWRDMKVYNNHVFIVADNNGNHGMQIFDLTQLRTADPENPQFFSNTAHYSGFGQAHNIVINEDTGYAYIVGGDVSSGGLHILDISDPLNPSYAGQFTGDGYTHDAQVVVYHGPDTDYAGKEIAFNSNTDTLTIVDVDDKSDISQISRTGYSGSEYSHQGWLSEDHRFFYMDDELDELNASTPIPTRTRIWDVQDLDNPVYLGYHDGVEGTIDHNLYVKGNYIYQANYTSGLRVLKVNDAATLDVEEYGFFDTYNTDNNVSFNGAWSCYPFFESGSIIVSDRQNGLFIVRTAMVEVVPESFEVIRGFTTSGEIEDLYVSDDFSANFSPFKRKLCLFEATAVCPFVNPSRLVFNLESYCAYPRLGISIQIKLYDYDTESWEVVHQGTAPIGSDKRLEVEFTNDVTRFVNAETGQVKAQIRYLNSLPDKLRANVFTVSVDQVGWIFEDEQDGN